MGIICPLVSGGGVIKRPPPEDIFKQTPAGMSLVWGKLVHLLTGYSIPHPGRPFMVTSPCNTGYFSSIPSPPKRWIVLPVRVIYPACCRSASNITFQIRSSLSLRVCLAYAPRTSHSSRLTLLSPIRTVCALASINLNSCSFSGTPFIALSKAINQCLL